MMNKRGEEKSIEELLVKIALTVFAIFILGSIIYMIFWDRLTPFVRNLPTFGITDSWVKQDLGIFRYALSPSKKQNSIQYYDGLNWKNFDGDYYEFNKKRVYSGMLGNQFYTYLALIKSRANTKIPNLLIGPYRLDIDVVTSANPQTGLKVGDVIVHFVDISNNQIVARAKVEGRDLKFYGKEGSRFSLSEEMRKKAADFEVAEEYFKKDKLSKEVLLDEVAKWKASGSIGEMEVSYFDVKDEKKPKICKVSVKVKEIESNYHIDVNDPIQHLGCEDYNKSLPSSIPVVQKKYGFLETICFMRGIEEQATLSDLSPGAAEIATLVGATSVSEFAREIQKLPSILPEEGSLVTRKRLSHVQYAVVEQDFGKIKHLNGNAFVIADDGRTILGQVGSLGEIAPLSDKSKGIVRGLGYVVDESSLTLSKLGVQLGETLPAVSKHARWIDVTTGKFVTFADGVPVKLDGVLRLFPKASTLGSILSKAGAIAGVYGLLCDTYKTGMMINSYVNAMYEIQNSQYSSNSLDDWYSSYYLRVLKLLNELESIISSDENNDKMSPQESAFISNMKFFISDARKDVNELHKRYLFYKSNGDKVVVKTTDASNLGSSVLDPFLKDITGEITPNEAKELYGHYKRIYEELEMMRIAMTTLDPSLKYNFGSSSSILGNVDFMLEKENIRHGNPQVYNKDNRIYYEGKETNLYIKPVDKNFYGNEIQNPYLIRRYGLFADLPFYKGDKEIGFLKLDGDAYVIKFYEDGISKAAQQMSGEDRLLFSELVLRLRNAKIIGNDIYYSNVDVEKLK